MKSLSRRIRDKASLHLRRLLAGAIAGIKGFSAARTSIKFLLGVLAVLVPLSILMFHPPSKATANIITVNNTTDPASTSGNGFCTLREAINNANAPVSIRPVQTAQLAPATT
jgi:CSLREA domain-containing protein